MPITRVIPRNALPSPRTKQKSYALSSNSSIQTEETNGNNEDNEKLYQRQTLDSVKKSNGSSKTFSTTSTPVTPQSQESRRSMPNDKSTTRRRSKPDLQSAMPSSNGFKQQISTINGWANEKSTNQNNQQQGQSNQGKPKCSLPASICQPGYVTPSKLFNMMGYGLQNQYLLMHAHYLYIIDCRSREKFHDSHIVTAIYWEDALNGNVYISVVERFSEIVLYDDTGIFFNATAEMRRVSSRFALPGSKSCISLDGGFEAFRQLFPFVCTQSDIRSAVDREKFLTIYPSVVLDNQLYLGTGHQATNWKVVRDLKLTHIINISVEHQCVFYDKIKYLHIELEDNEDVFLKDRFNETIRFMNMAFQNPSSRILVHCNLGISRSSTLVLAYLMKTYNATLYESYKFLRHRRPIVCPNLGFLRQLIDFEQDLFSCTYTDPNDQLFH
ncbi:unnamed protein product [Rotaria socialis]|uniref:protein-tyrosine-phosphatase n=1 Tax=Rotaria socialis TaxID=392032 RepID=A0A818S1Z4_9BILA|nr:unnamed protein product [Rotaria socialis]CAF4768862.1 unnamed protein product [Rotaria socialis]